MSLSSFDMIANNWNNNLLYYWGYLTNRLIFDTTNINLVDYPLDSLWAGIIKYDLINNKQREVINLFGEQSTEEVLFPTATNWITEGLASRIKTKNL
jgi:hypothetical protein